MNFWFASRLGGRRIVQMERPSRALLAAASGALLSGSLLSGASAQVVIPDGGFSSGEVLADGVSLTVEAGGTISSFVPGGNAVDANSGGANAIGNAGLINGPGLGDFGVALSNGTSVSVTNSGRIVGSSAGIFGTVAGDDISGLLNMSTGVIDGLSGISLSFGSLSNADNAGQIVGHGFSGIFLGPGGALINLANSGLIQGNTNGISADSIYGLTNLAGGTITGLNANGITVSGTFLANLTNAGLISGGGGYGIYVPNDNLFSFTNLSTGIVRGSTTGIEAGGTVGNFSNAGQIIGLTDYGLSVINGGLVLGRNQQGGVISGADSGFSFTNAYILRFTNAGLIVGETNTGIVSLGGDITELTNLSSGTIRGAIFGLAANGGADIEDLVNAGVIETTGNGATAGIQVFSGGTGDLINFVNTGIVRSIGDGLGSTKFGVSVVGGRIDNLYNSGTIEADNTGGGQAYGIFGTNLVSLTNTGRISANLGAGNYAILEGGLGADTDLTLLPGSVIQGRIDIEGGGAGTNRLFVGQGLNLATTFETDLPDSIETHGALRAADPATGLVSVADTSVLAAEENGFSDMMRGVSGSLSRQLDAKRQSPDRIWWLDGLGGIAHVNGSGPATDVRSAFGGLVGGADVELDNRTRAGLFGGLAAGNLTADVTNGESLGTKSFFAGAYGRHATGRWYTDINLTAGFGRSSFERIVANNLVPGGLETATADFTSYFLSPEITVGASEGFGSRKIRPSATLRYGFLHSAGFTESGLTAGGLSAGARTSHILDMRLQAAMPVDIRQPGTKVEVRAGLDGHATMGGEFDAALAGVSLGAFDPGGETFAAGGFVGADVSRAISGTTSFFASGELGAGSGAAFRAGIRAGVKGTF